MRHENGFETSPRHPAIGIGTESDPYIQLDVATSRTCWKFRCRSPNCPRSMGPKWSEIGWPGLERRRSETPVDVMFDVVGNRLLPAGDAERVELASSNGVTRFSAKAALTGASLPLVSPAPATQSSLHRIASIDGAEEVWRNRWNAPKGRRRIARGRAERRPGSGSHHIKAAL